MRIALSMFLTPIDGGEVVRITDYNTRQTLFEGKKFMCPFLKVDIVSVWTNNGRIIIEVV